MTVCLLLLLLLVTTSSQRNRLKTVFPRRQRGRRIFSMCAMISITFANALTGGNTPTMSVPHDDDMSLRVLLGPLANIFKYIIGTDEFDWEERLVNHLVGGHVTVNFLTSRVTFLVYFHDKVSRRSWFLCDTVVDVLAHIRVGSPVELRTVPSTIFTAAILWDEWLRHRLWNCDLVGPMAMYRAIVRNIDNDIMSIPRVRRRNVLHEMREPLGVHIYFVLDDDNYLNLRLRPPEDEVRVLDGEFGETLRHAVMELYH